MQELKNNDKEQEMEVEEDLEGILAFENFIVYDIEGDYEEDIVEVCFVKNINIESELVFFMLFNVVITYATILITDKINSQQICIKFTYVFFLIKTTMPKSDCYIECNHLQ